MSLPVWPNSHVLFMENTAQILAGAWMHSDLLGGGVPDGGWVEGAGGAF